MALVVPGLGRSLIRVRGPRRQAAGLVKHRHYAAAIGMPEITAASPVAQTPQLGPAGAPAVLACENVPVPSRDPCRALKPGKQKIRASIARVAVAECA